MYKSPIELLTAEIQAKLEDGVVDLLKHIDINVDKDELIRALRYDRKQYDNGFSDGRLAGLDEQYAMPGLSGARIVSIAAKASHLPASTRA